MLSSAEDDEDLSAGVRLDRTGHRRVEREYGCALVSSLAYSHVHTIAVHLRMEHFSAELADRHARWILNRG